jgi:hypothetical protein
MTEYTTEQHVRYMGCLFLNDAIGFFLLRHEVGTDTWAALFNSFPRGQKTKMKEQARELERRGDAILRDYADQISDRAEADDHCGVQELLMELDERAVGYVTARVSEEGAKMIARINEQEAA